jgi:hypothetical protein
MLKAAANDAERPQPRCPQCDEIDPLITPTATGWLQGELKPPK